MEQKIILIIVLFVTVSLLVVSCGEAESPPERVPTPVQEAEPEAAEEPMAIEQEKEQEKEQEDAVEPEVAPNSIIEPESTTKEISIIARKWEFDPAVITVKEGDSVKLDITSEDVTHGIVLSTFGIREVLKPGKTSTVEFVADTKGTFSFFCSIPCGSGHSQMKGTLIVE